MTTIPASERSMSYAPVAATGPFPIDFPLFDDTGADLYVTLDGEEVGGWTFSGTLESGFYGAPNTWVDGSITFAAPITGALVIEGLRAPRRPGQFAEGRGVPARDLNVEFNRLTAVAQEARRDIGKMLTAVDQAEDARDRAEDAAEDAEASLLTMQTYILGAGPVFPTVDAQGNPVVDYARFILTDQVDPADDGEYYRLAPGWERIPGLPPGSFRRTGHFFVTSTEAASGVVPVSTGYVPPYIDVFRNGSRQLVGVPTGTDDDDFDCEASDGLTIAFPPDVLFADDVIDWVASHPRAVDVIDAVDVTFTPTPDVPQANVQAAVAALGVILTALGVEVDDLPTVAGMNAAIAAGLSTANAGGIVLVSSGTVASPQSQIDIPLTGTYRQYKLVADQIEPATAGSYLVLRLSFDGGSTYPSGASDFSFAGTYATDSAAPAGANAPAANGIYISTPMGVASGKPALFDVDLSVPAVSGRAAAAKWKSAYRSNGGNLVSHDGTGSPNVSSVRPTHARLVFTAGNIAAGARWQLYGYRD